MATLHTQSTARFMMAPAVIMLFLWMAVPLALTLYFSFRYYTLLDPLFTGWAGLDNYYYFLTDPNFSAAVVNTLLLVGGVLLITIVGGVLLALLLDQPIFGQGIVRLLVIAPFFVMPTVTALVWSNMMMDPEKGVLSWLMIALGLDPIIWFRDAPLTAITLIVAWQWLPFATLILLTALQSLSEEQKEAAEMDGAGALSIFTYITLPHLARAITVVILIETIFLLTVFAEIYVTTNGGPGNATMNISYLVYFSGRVANDIGLASAGGVLAVVLANIVAVFLVRIVGRNLDA